jgi:hypothetical protein
MLNLLLWQETNSHMYATHRSHRLTRASTLAHLGIPVCLLAYLYGFQFETLVLFGFFPQRESVCKNGLALGNRRDYVRTTQPVSLGKVRRRPLRRMVRMRVIESGDTQPLHARFTLDSDQFSKGNLVAIMRRIRACIPRLDRCVDRPALSSRLPKQRAAALMRRSLLAVGRIAAAVESCGGGALPGGGGVPGVP